MKKIIAISYVTVKEAIRDKVFYSILAFAILMLVFSMVLGNLTIGQPVKIIKDFGLASISLFGTLIAIFVGIGSIYKEMDKKTIYVILSKPISRGQFLIGKYIGLSIIITFEVIIMSLMLFVILMVYYEQDFPIKMLVAIIPTWFELNFILAVALFFSSFTTPFLSGLFTLSTFVIGHLVADLQILARTMGDQFFIMCSNIISYLFPNLENLNYSTRVVHNLPINLNEFLLSLFYSVVYTILILSISIVIFNKRDIR